MFADYATLETNIVALTPGVAIIVTIRVAIFVSRVANIVYLGSINCYPNCNYNCYPGINRNFLMSFR